MLTLLLTVKQTTKISSRFEKIMLTFVIFYKAAHLLYHFMMTR